MIFCVLEIFCLERQDNTLWSGSDRSAPQWCTFFFLLSEASRGFGSCFLWPSVVVYPGYRFQSVCCIRSAGEWNVLLDCFGTLVVAFLFTVMSAGVLQYVLPPLGVVCVVVTCHPLFVIMHRSSRRQESLGLTCWPSLAWWSSLSRSSAELH